MGDILVNPEDIDFCGKFYSGTSDDWLSEVARARVLDISALGDDRIGVMLKSFHGRTNTKVVDYFVEVGECADDVGAALRGMARAYGSVELTNAEQAGRVIHELAHVGLVW